MLIFLLILNLNNHSVKISTYLHTHGHRLNGVSVLKSKRKKRKISEEVVLKRWVKKKTKMSIVSKLLNMMTGSYK